MKKFANGGLVPKLDKDAKEVILERGWYICKKCGTLFEACDSYLNWHTCSEKNDGSESNQPYPKNNRL